MLQDSFFKTNFIGQDGFTWWIGKIAPIEAQGKQVSGDGWGNRFKVRIIGYHPRNKSELKDIDLPWAIALLPATAGTGGANKGQSVRYRPGDSVVGFFIDGNNAQVPVIMGALGRTSDVSQDAPDPEDGFAPSTAFSKNVPTGDGTLDKGEANESNSNSLKSPVLRNASGDEISASKGFGNTESVADTCDDSFLNDISSTLSNLSSGISNTTNLFTDIASASHKIENLSNGLVNNMMGKLYTNMIPQLSTGLQSLYATTFAATGSELAAVAAQKAMIGPIKNLQNGLDCLPGKIQSGLSSTIQGLLGEFLSDSIKAGDCVSEQFTGSLLNNISDQISSELEGALGGLSSVLPPSIKVQDILLSSADTFTSIGGLFDCNQNKSKCVGKVKKQKIGSGSQPVPNLLSTVSNITKAFNSAAGGSPSFPNPKCSEPSFCDGPSITFFGGDGNGGLGRLILGEFVENTPDLSQVTADVSRTASIIGVEIADPGSNYLVKPPLVSISDPCELGYGAVARAKIDSDSTSPTFGQIISVDIISEGENYPVGNDASDAISSDNVLVGVVDTIIEKSGSGYEDAVVTDSNGVQYNVTIGGGKIISAQPINNIAITNKPNIVIQSQTGSGALIKPVIKQLSLDPQGEIIQVIDCVGPETNFIVGYVNGKPYSGPFHLHPKRGVKMVGAVHVDTPHDIIYDTPAESLRQRVSSGISTTTTSSDSSMSTPNITPTTNVPTSSNEPPSTPSTSSPSTPPSSSPSTPSSNPPSGGGGYGGY